MFSRIGHNISNRIITVFIIKAVGTALMLLLNLAMARLLGTEGYGIFAYALSWILVLSIPAKLGTDNLIVREASILKSSKEWGKIKGVYFYANMAVIFSSLLIAAVSMSAFWAAYDRMMYSALMIAIFILPFFSLCSVQQSTLRGLQKIILSQLPETLVKPILLFLGLFVLWLAREHVSQAEVLYLYLIVTVIILFLYSYTIKVSLLKGKPVYPSSHEIILWTKSIIPFALLDAAAIINSRADVIMLGILKNPESAGIYNVATSGSDTVSFMLIAVNMTIAPSIASLYHQKKFEQLHAIMRKGARIAFCAGLPLVLVMVFFGGWLLLFFGPDFVGGRQALAILSIGQIINTGTGSVGLMLNMTGNEKIAATGFGIASIANIALNFLLIPHWGLNGAAVATFTTTTLWNFLLLYFVKNKMNFNPSIFG